MTTIEYAFYKKIELNRGSIKNINKFEPIVCDILDYGIYEWRNEAILLKRFGLQFIWEVVTTLNPVHQLELIKDINSLKIINITNAKFEFAKIKAKYSY